MPKQGELIPLVPILGEKRSAPAFIAGKFYLGTFLCHVMAIDVYLGAVCGTFDRVAL